MAMSDDADTEADLDEAAEPTVGGHRPAAVNLVDRIEQVHCKWQQPEESRGNILQVDNNERSRATRARSRSRSMQYVAGHLRAAQH